VTSIPHQVAAPPQAAPGRGAPGAGVIAPHVRSRRAAAPSPLVVRGAPAAVDWARVISDVFFASAAVYGAATLAILFPVVRAVSPDLVTREGAVTHLAMNLAASGLCLLAAYGYRLPGSQGRPLWSVPLVWLHVLVLHGAYLTAAIGFFVYHAAEDPGWWQWLAWGAVASASGLVMMTGNLYASLRTPGGADETGGSQGWSK